MLSTEKLKLRLASRKLADKWIGPFKVLELKGENALKLELPPRLGKVHPVQNVEYIKPYVTRDKEGKLIQPEGQDVSEQEVVIIDGQEFEEVEQIFASRFFGKKKQYLVRLKGHGVLDDYWHDATDLKRHASWLVGRFEARQVALSAKKERSRQRHRRG